MTTGTTTTIPAAQRTPAPAAPPNRRDHRRPGPHGPGRRGPGPSAPATSTSGTPRTPVSASPTMAAAAAARRHQPHWWFAERLVEVLSGQRPAGWMLRYFAGETSYDQLWDLACRGILRPPAGRPTPVVWRCDQRKPVPDVMEAFARVACGDALRALAFRLERDLGQRWRCTAVEAAGPPW